MALIEEQTQYNTATILSAGFWPYQVQGLIVPNRRIVSLSFVLDNVGGADWEHEFLIWRASDGAIIARTGDYFDIFIPGAPTWITWDLLAPVLVNEEVYIGVRHTAGIGIVKCIRAYRQSTDVKPSESFLWSGNGIAWNRISDNDFAYRYSFFIIPLVTTDVSTSPVLDGTLNDDGGEACACGFQWGETVAYGNITPTQNRTTGQTFTQTLVGLDPNKTYHFRAFATNSAGTGYGSDRVLLSLPGVRTDPATGVT